MDALPPDDTLAIQQLYARYNHAIHRGDGAAWAACFTPDATFSNARESVAGAKALAAYADDFSKSANARYWIDNLVLEAAPGGASGTCYLALYHVVAVPERLAPRLTGIYTDTLTRFEGEWRFRSRHIARD